MHKQCNTSAHTAQLLSYKFIMTEDLTESTAYGSFLRDPVAVLATKPTLFRRVDTNLLGVFLISYLMYFWYWDVAREAV